MTGGCKVASLHDQCEALGTRGMPVDLQHQIGREVGNTIVALGLGLVACSCAVVVCHHLLTGPLGQAGTEWHLGQYWLAVTMILHITYLLP